MWEFIDKEIKKQTESEEKSQKSCRLEAGQTCPQCGNSTLEYNGLLNLVCPACGYELAGSFT